ncbi:photosynthetic complex assembly protein PuhC [Sulfitobacter aestuariivivens]|uniref:Photosynthetic complex assembly protein n=1 Tax=Sulfitobacter aestuariivivens TaxID=2766981 RepID=A0A927D4W4_9RHOB|nr:photosynthetic complex assembly protein PuhC [Sulfitobacter aestuariivivens]MBD3665029.1 photosynthetic complex assembly protein [Sulfitobacter aestuariivivens]
MAQTSSLANQMKHRDREMVPRFLVQAMFGLMIASLALVAYAQLTDQPQRGVPVHSDIVAERSITLAGTRSDGVAVLNAAGTQIAHSTADKAGFIDVIWVGVMRERKIQGAPLDAPVRLVRRANGHTAIIDDTTNWSIELIGYGQDNVAAFARLID